MEIDWEEKWTKKMQEREKMKRKPSGNEYWSKRAEDFSDFRRTNDYEYGRKVLNVLFRDKVLSSESKVLEIGPGPGTFVIPFAEEVEEVTPVEPAEGMIEKMVENAEEAGIENYDIKNKKWQDVDISALPGKYDLVICSTVLWVFKDIWEQLRRMERATEGHCCIVTGVGSWNGKRELWRKVMGDAERPDYSIFPLIYNLLYSKDRFPNIRIIKYRSERSEANVARYRKLFFSRHTEVTPEVEKEIEKHVSEISKGGKVVREGKSAVVWWRV